jgi:hypothetical protein
MGPPGHFSIALAVKPVAPKVPLWVLLLATEVLDLLCFAFAAIGVENLGVSHSDFVHGTQVIVPASIPWSHGLFMSIVWAVAAAVIGWIVYRDRWSGSIIGLAVFSHWVMDFIVHPPYLPLLFNGSPTVGLGLSTSGLGAILNVFLEFGLLAGGIAIYWAYRKRRLVSHSPPSSVVRSQALSVSKE